MKRKICVVLMLSLLLCLFVSTMDASAIVNEQKQEPSQNPEPVVTESGDDDGGNGGGNGGNNNTNRPTAPKADSSSDEQQIMEEYKNNPEKIREDYPGLEEMKNPAIAEHTTHSGSSKQITISTKSIDPETPIAAYIVYHKDGKTVRVPVKFVRDGKKVIVNVPQDILDLHLDEFDVDIISDTLA